MIKFNDYTFCGGRGVTLFRLKPEDLVYENFSRRLRRALSRAPKQMRLALSIPRAKRLERLLAEAVDSFPAGMSDKLIAQFVKQRSKIMMRGATSEWKISKVLFGYEEITFRFLHLSSRQVVKTSIAVLTIETPLTICLKVGPFENRRFETAIFSFPRNRIDVLSFAELD
ncbi:MAG: hypothetical protein Q4B29_02385 [Candidatus Saccharibacteria bacterium]|nr:hypothetical protein [Candidatus Saccharibacteria bacterium]